MRLYLVLFIVCLSNSLYGQEKDCKQLFDLPSRDSTFVNRVIYCTEEIENYYYYSAVRSSVCNDTLCQLLQINIFWDLAGNFVNFDIQPGMPLTKHDHLPFSIEDYKKLHDVLMDNTSILGDIKEENLIDNSIKKYSQKIDGLTGATAKNIKSELVDGAPYTTYTLWNLVNGDIVSKMKNHTISISNSVIKKQLLNSTNPKTIIFGLKMFTEKDYLDNFQLIFSIMQLDNPFVNFYIAKNLPESVLWIDKNKEQLKIIWEHSDYNTKSILQKYFKIE